MVEEPFGWRAAIDLECDEDAARSQAKRDSGCGAGGGRSGNQGIGCFIKFRLMNSSAGPRNAGG